MISTIARIVYGLVIGIFGAMHLLFPTEFVHLVPTYLPGGIAWMYIVGTSLVLAGLAIISGIILRTACNLLALLLFAFIILVRLPMALSADHLAIQEALKMSGLLAAALFIGNAQRR